MSDPDATPPDQPPKPSSSEGVQAADRTRIAVGPDQGTRIQTDAPSTGFTRVVAPGVLINENYRILRLVSAGGMGEVYRAENIFTGDPVAVKIILPNLARDENIIELFRREARTLVQMRDDAIVRYHNFIRDRGLNRYCLIMEFVEGQHLWDFVKERGPLEVDSALILLRRLAHGLAEAHARGVTHRDLSPDNVILRDNRLDEAVLIDFGIARSTEFGDGLNGRFAGKFKYIAPEQLGHSRGQIGPWTDVYGLALMIAAALRGSPVEMGNSIVEASELRRHIPDLGGISHRIYPLLQHMLEPEPQNRPHDMQAVLAILDDPNHLAARYRLPLWGGQNPRVEPSPEGGTGPELPPHDDLGSASPFERLQVAAQAEIQPIKAPKTRKLWLIAAICLGLAIAAGWGLIPSPQTVPEQPVETAQSPLAPLPPRDLESREGFLAEQPVADCTFVMRIAHGPDAGKLRQISAHPSDLEKLRDDYAAKFAGRPALVTSEITQSQCAALDFVRALTGREAAPPVLALDSSQITSGTEVSGRIRELSGRKLWLFLVSPKGAVYDLSRLASAQADGAFTFSFGISLAEGETRTEPQLLVAVVSDQPLTSVAAAPAGSDVSRLLPLVLSEIQKQGGASAVDMAPFTVSAPPEPVSQDQAPPLPPELIEPDGQ
ncbi:serine/threonine-protein kinase [Paracoccus sp. (in: a-proteobacteria)]|uniref:serine/threonine-protein kinase n=1 Tax=Paracoccus sp. TaxID=267 RepID=UPI00289E3F2B|nr:serine/threonine-protein kinase [Paracoccus sp. (in: a-proteobacteria)]